MWKLCVGLLLPPPPKELIFTFIHPYEKARELLAVSEKYCLVGLKAQCGNSLIKQISLETVADLAILADLYSVQDLHSKAIRFIVEHRDQLKNNKSWMEKFQNNPLMEVVNALL